MIVLCWKIKPLFLLMIPSCKAFPFEIQKVQFPVANIEKGEKYSEIKRNEKLCNLQCVRIEYGGRFVIS
jgi:hypothetical protein